LPDIESGFNTWATPVWRSISAANLRPVLVREDASMLSVRWVMTSSLGAGCCQPALREDVSEFKVRVLGQWVTGVAIQSPSTSLGLESNPSLERTDARVV